MERSVFDSISPIDYRYWDSEVAIYLSEDGFTRYKLIAEYALVKVLYRRGVCSEKVVKEVEEACKKVSTEQVYKEEKRIGHDIRALVNSICSKIDRKARPFVHRMATSFDISDSANAARYKDVITDVLLPNLFELREVLANISFRESETVQIGRTHGQHAVPITFGFAIAEYVNRIQDSAEHLEYLLEKIPGKFSGAVGAYNALKLFFDDPEDFERDFLWELGLVPARQSTQVVPPEPLIRVFSEIVAIAGILANLSDDMRNLQRTEIGEVGERFGAEQVGSSTMPQKRNPINFENAKSLWKIVLPRIITVFMDQISEHQRDLTNSASARTYGEMIAYVVSTIKRLKRTMEKLVVDPENLKRNFEMQKDFIAAEPLYLILASLGHPSAHEKVRKLTLKMQEEGVTLREAINGDQELNSYIREMTEEQKMVIIDPSEYTGIAGEIARRTIS
jgi:adenylosuccinate lyase